MIGETHTETRLGSTSTGERRYEVVVIAASTGGPAALDVVLGGLGTEFDLPIQPLTPKCIPAFVVLSNVPIPFCAGKVIGIMRRLMRYVSKEWFAVAPI